MFITCGNLVPFDKRMGFRFDPLALWLKHLGLWSEEMEERIKLAEYHLPLDIETEVRQKLGLPISDERTREILETITQSNNGVCVTKYKDYDLYRIRLLEQVLLLIREDTSSKTYKPLAPAFNIGVKYLVGVVDAQKLCK